ncbi:tail completion protein gp17 [Tardiphaga sp. 862_B3_N1_1]|uniref:tail completion protein gp17 n=1 Tax=Tardiphaga sp. 862_B3_N1_1 TaxID=3240763 RepID=UPI003F89845A
MKDLRPALRAFLLGDAAISTAVGGARLFPIKMPQGTKVASIVYSRISGRGDHHMMGPSGLGRPRYQIDAWAPSADAAVSLADLVKVRLDGFRGVMGSGQAAVVVQGVFLADEREDYDDTVTMNRLSRDYFIDFEEV